GGTQGARRGRAKSALYYRYNCRNRLRFAAQHLPRATILRWLMTTPAVSREILLRGGRRQLLSQPWLLMAAVRGSVAGLVQSAQASEDDDHHRAEGEAQHQRHGDAHRSGTPGIGSPPCA
ncbi:MAG: hypothetical protein KY439_12225, partial [Actinobacteria bacterium]|nr:hypothetical protein [Actinomycetota bacterium]